MFGNESRPTLVVVKMTVSNDFLPTKRVLLRVNLGLFKGRLVKTKKFLVEMLTF